MLTPPLNAAPHRTSAPASAVVRLLASTALSAASNACVWLMSCLASATEAQGRENPGRRLCNMAKRDMWRLVTCAQSDREGWGRGRGQGLHRPPARHVVMGFGTTWMRIASCLQFRPLPCPHTNGTAGGIISLQCRNPGGAWVQTAMGTVVPCCMAAEINESQAAAAPAEGKSSRTEVFGSDGVGVWHKSMVRHR